MRSPLTWANTIFGQAALGDKRRIKRLVKVAATLAAKPLDSFCQAYETWSEIKGAYRLIANKQITSEMLMTPSTEHAVKACLNHPVILAVSDTTSLNFTNHRATLGLGPISEIQYQGLHFHSTLALRPDGLPLGLIRQKVWVRDKSEYGKKHKRTHKPIQDKESFNWIEDITHIDHALDSLEENERPYVIHIFDREGDIYEVFQAIQKDGAGCVIRSAWNRRITEEQNYLHDHVLNTKVIHRQLQEVKRQSGKPKRQALLEYRATTVTLEPSLRKFRPREPLQINIVAVHEINPPKNIEPIQWFLNTTEPVAPRARPPNLKTAILWIGRLGGHIGRKSDGMPGVRSLWRGWRDLQVLIVMFEIYQPMSSEASI